jgi:hypothetical protein
LKSRGDIDTAQIGLLGVSQAGWIMPLAAARAKDLAFLISISGAGVSPAETTIDQAQNEMTARGMKPQTVADIVAIGTIHCSFSPTRIPASLRRRSEAMRKCRPCSASCRPISQPFQSWLAKRIRGFDAPR